MVKNPRKELMFGKHPAELLKSTTDNSKKVEENKKVPSAIYFLLGITG